MHVVCFEIVNTMGVLPSAKTTPDDKAIQLLYKRHKQRKVRNLYSILYMEKDGWVEVQKCINFRQAADRAKYY
jgi:hypothetical protein